MKRCIRADGLSRPGPGPIVVQNCWKHWPCLFPQHVPGRKHERELRLEDWQRELLEEHTVEFLRGLLRSDGCRTNNWATGMVGGVKKRYEYPRWEFVNHSDDIRRWCIESLDRLGIPWRQSSWKASRSRPAQASPGSTSWSARSTDRGQGRR